MTPEIERLEAQIEQLKQELSKARREAPPQPVKDYTFKTADGDTTLSQLFGDKQNLLVVHNMGKSCDYCTMWADVLQSQLRHLETRAAVVIVSPDPPEVQQEHAKGRGWTVRMASDRGGDFTPDMGFKTEKEGYWPGVSAFHKSPNGSMVRTGRAVFGPGDDFCPPWHFFDLLPGGSEGWEPK
jgi:predicted dithiol-disulfide oxidoreductase (DUF899 family)